MQNMAWSEELLNEMLTQPSEQLIQCMARLEGDIMVLGAGGKMGPDICVLAKKASDAAGVKRKVYAVSRFSDKGAEKQLNDHQVQTISMDLLQPGNLDKLPDCENIIFMAGKKFGTAGNEYLTWGMNSWLPCNCLLYTSPSPRDTR